VARATSVPTTLSIKDDGIICLNKHLTWFVLARKKQQVLSRKRTLDGEKEARLISIACSRPPEGFAKWTMQMLADELVALKVVDSVSHQTVWRTLKKTNLNLT
jgi:transposase